jgi:hypothetical protein
MGSIGTGQPGQESPQRVLRGSGPQQRENFIVSSDPGSTTSEGARVSLVNLGDSLRLTVFLVPQKGGSFLEQAIEVLTTLRQILAKQPMPMTVTTQTVFVRNETDRQECEQVFRGEMGGDLPLTNFVIQPPCGGEALSIEVWAIGGQSVRLERFGPHGLAVSYDSVRWVYCAGVSPSTSSRRSRATPTRTLPFSRRS